MSHDPLCPSYDLCDCGCESAWCMCNFIAKVREDESVTCFEHQKAAADAAMTLSAQAHKLTREQGIRYCIDVVEDLSLHDDHGTLTAVEFKDRVIAAMHCLIEREMSE